MICFYLFFTIKEIDLLCMIYTCSTKYSTKKMGIRQNMRTLAVIFFQYTNTDLCNLTTDIPSKKIFNYFTNPAFPRKNAVPNRYR